MAALLKSAESKDFVGSNPTLSATSTSTAGAVRDAGVAPRRPVRRVPALAHGPRPSADRCSACASGRATDPRFPRYPALPVAARAPGFEPPDRRPSPRRTPGRPASGRALDARDARLPILRATSRTTGCERDEYPSHVGTETRWLVEPGRRRQGMDPGASGPNAGGATADRQ